MINFLVRFAKPIVDRYPRMALFYRCLRDSWQTVGEPQETPMGFKLSSNYPMIQRGEFEPEETEIVKKILPQIDVVINVGANIGYYCCIALSYGKYVVAFEPISLNIKYLLRNVKANNWESRIEVFPLALSNKIGVVEIYGGAVTGSLVKGWAGTPDEYVSLVPCSTLDHVLGSRFHNKRCFFVVDIEGAERYMLEGASSFLNFEPKPIWLMEINITENLPKGVLINDNLLPTFQMFWNRGYESWTADSHCRLINNDEIENIVRTGKDTILTHNFLFIEKGKKREFFNI